MNRPAFVHFTCFSLFKVYPLVRSSLIHGVCFIQHQHLAMNLHKFISLYLQKGTQRHLVPHWRNQWVEHPYVWSGCFLPLNWTMECCPWLATHHPMRIHGVKYQHLPVVFTVKFQNCLYFLYIGAYIFSQFISLVRSTASKRHCTVKRIHPATCNSHMKDRWVEWWICLKIERLPGASRKKRLKLTMNKDWQNYRSNSKYSPN